MSPTTKSHADTLVQDALDAFEKIDGKHPGFRAAHAKGILLAGQFLPASDGKTLTRAPHVQRQSTPVTVRFSNFGGMPAIADGSSEASPRGIAIRFHLAEHVHTDIIAHSVDGFPTRTAEEFVEFLRAAGASGPGIEHPNPIERFLTAHPAALAFIQTPKPVPASFAKVTYFGVTAYRFTNAAGVARFGRYRILPEGGNEFVDPSAASEMPVDFLFDDIRRRLAGGKITMQIAVQLAAPDDVTDDATVHWPEDRPQSAFGSIEISSIVPNNDDEQQHIIFDPIPRVDGIEPSADPLLEPRASIYLAGGRKRRARQ